MKITSIILLLIIYIYFSQISPFVFPGIVFFFITSLKLSTFDRVFISLALSISYWITGFWILKYLPITHSDFINWSMIGTFLLFLFSSEDKFTTDKIAIRKSDAIAIVFSLVIFLTFYLPLSKQIAPSGADMTTHSYIAQTIIYHDSFPKTYEPIAPSNHFGSSYMGLPILMATISNIAQVPILTSGLIATIAVFLLFAVSLYILLNNIYPPTISAFASFTLIWVGEDVTRYIYWGGVPTILAISLLTFGLILLINVLQSKKFFFHHAILLATIVYAAFTTHHFTIAILGYLSLAIILTDWKYFYFILKEKRMPGFVLTFVIMLIVLAIPFLLNLEIPKTLVFDQIKNEQLTQDYSTKWLGNIQNIIWTLPAYLEGRIGFPVLFIGLLGLFTINFKHKWAKWCSVAIITTLALIINNKYWLLPLSALLYPDRLLTLSLVPLSLVIANYIKNIEGLTMAYFREFRSFGYKLNFVIAVMLLFGLLLNIGISNYRDLFGNNSAVLVTQNDLEVFKWISENTSTDDVFINNYGDAGIWIPALTSRKVTTYDATFYDFDNFKLGVQSLSPTYLFIGSRAVYPDAIAYKYETIKISPDYLHVFSSGNSHLFKKIINAI